MSRKPEPGEFSERRAVVERLESVSAAERERIMDAFYSDESPAACDWSELGPERTLGTVLEQLARVKVIVPEDNQQVQKDGHNRTVENHIKFALEVAGTQENLELYLEMLRVQLEQGGNPGREELARQTLLIWAPVAEINGWYSTKTELEDLAFPVLYPDEARKIDQIYATDTEAIHAEAHIYGELVWMGIEHYAPQLLGHFQIETRQKSAYSIWRRAERKRRAQKAQEVDYRIPDFIGIRVIVDSAIGEESAVEYCYAVAGAVSGLLGGEKDGDEEKTEWLRDHINPPKANGYQSLHLRLQDTESEFEVQIRTSEMHRLAEEDSSMSHMAYEAWKKVTPGRIFRRGLSKPSKSLQWRDEAAQRIADNSGQLAGLRPDHTLVFRRDGNLFELADGDTMLDFSFAVQSRRALRTKALMVKGRLSGLDKPVQFGDCVEIVYARTPQWKETWLEKTESARAHKRLRLARKEKHAEAYQQKAERLIEDAFAPLGIEDPIDILTEEDREALARKYTTSNLEMVLREIGAGARPDKFINQIQRRLAVNQEAPDTTTDLLAKRRIEENQEGQIEITGLEGCAYRLGQCCRPRPHASPIRGMASRPYGGVTIHRADCVNLSSNRALDCRWKTA